DDCASADRGMALVVDLGGSIHRRRNAAQGDSVIQGHIIADFGSLADHDSHPVVDEKAPANRSAGMDLDARGASPNLRHNSPKQPPPMLPEPVRRPVEKQDMHTRISKQNLKA